jgi:histidine triad (HIT) family protein
MSSPLRTNLRDHAVRIARFSARSPHIVRLFIWMIETFPLALPLARLRETPTLLAFFHPAPSHPYHVLLIPRKPIPSLADLDPAAESAFLTDLFAAVQSLVDEYRLPAYRLIVNGGDYQDFPHLHFHLISDFNVSDSKVP